MNIPDLIMSLDSKLKRELRHCKRGDYGNTIAYATNKTVNINNTSYNPRLLSVIPDENDVVYLYLLNKKSVLIEKISITTINAIEIID